jgi:NitT/TauT family transport system substrate-binding protein
MSSRRFHEDPVREPGASGQCHRAGQGRYRRFIPGKEGQVDWLLVRAGVVASGKMVKDNPNTLKAVLRALNRATTTINANREASVKIVAAQMKMDEGMARDIMALNIYSMEMNDKIYRGMGG